MGVIGGPSCKINMNSYGIQTVFPQDSVLRHPFIFPNLTMWPPRSFRTMLDAKRAFTILGQSDKKIVNYQQN